MARTAAKFAFTAADALLPSPNGPRVLIYHQVGAGLGRQMEVTTDDFTRQLDWLSQNWEVVTFDQAVTRWDEPGADRLVALTFDDGYLDTFTTAFPMLRERQLPFLIYLATESIETGSPLGPPGRADPLAWDHVVDMLSSGLVTIGAHTHRHRDLRHLPAEAVEEELTTSDGLIERRLGLRPDHFAYPWGYWSSTAAAVVDRRYETAAIAGTPRPGTTLDRHRLHRYPVQLSDGFRFFPARLRGGFRVEEQVRRWIKRYSGP
ncbi:MAG: polysaccharide deacetylase family protein [Acidimicrobiia bacterium]